MNSNNFSELDYKTLCSLSGGAKISNWMIKLGTEFSKGTEIIVNGYSNLIHTCYDSGKQLGSYIRNW